MEREVPPLLWSCSGTALQDAVCVRCIEERDNICSRFSMVAMEFADNPQIYGDTSRYTTATMGLVVLVCICIERCAC